MQKEYRIKIFGIKFTFYHAFGFRLVLGTDEYYTIHICLILGGVFITLPIKTKYDDFDAPEYGIAYHDDIIWIYRGERYTAIDMPWVYDFIKREQDEPQTAPFAYIRNNGEIQNVTATFNEARLEHRQKWLKWTPYFARITRRIEIEFDKEVGEGVDDWKGGVLSASYPIGENESLTDAFNRIQREKRFDH